MACLAITEPYQVHDNGGIAIPSRDNRQRIRELMPDTGQLTGDR